MPDDHQMFFSTEHILCIRHQFHAVFSFDADDICIIFDADIDVPDRMTDPFRQRGNFVNGKIISEFHIVKDLICRKTDCNFFCNITVWINNFVRAVAQQELCVDITVGLAAAITTITFLSHFNGILNQKDLACCKIFTNTDKTVIKVSDTKTF